MVGFTSAAAPSPSADVLGPPLDLSTSSKSERLSSLIDTTQDLNLRGSTAAISSSLVAVSLNESCPRASARVSNTGMIIAIAAELLCLGNVDTLEVNVCTSESETSSGSSVSESVMKCKILG